MSILNKYKRWVPMLIPINDEYWDFVLSQDGTPSIGMGPRLNERCLAAYISFWDPECQELNGVRSYSKYYWERSKNNGAKLENIGYTGVDNGRIYYGGFANVSNKEFFDIFTKSVLEIPAGDNNLHLVRVTGNTGVYSYGMEYVDGKYWALKGGFFQGFYKLFGHDYQVLPQYVEDEWNVEITLRPRGYITDDNTLNNTHPGNDGIFFYMGTRAEDKFLEMYNCDISEYPDREQPDRHELTCDYFLDQMYEYIDKPTCEYFNDDYASGNEEKPSDYYSDGYASEDATEYCNGKYYGGENGTPCDKKEEPKPQPKPKPKPKPKKEYPKLSNVKKAKYLAYFLNHYGYKEYSSCGCDIKGKFVPPVVPPKPETAETDVCEISYIATGDSYYEKEIILSGLTLTTRDGKSLSDTGYYEIKTDNKFLTFNRTKYGFTTANWDEDVEILLTGTTEDFRTGNLFLLMDRTKSGYTTCTIDSYFKNNRKPYDFKKSLKGNAFAVRYNCDGSVGYKYLVKDCDAEDGWSVIEETSFPGIIKPEEWSTVTIKFNAIGGDVDDCGVPYGQRKMKIRIYVNGYLKFVSKELPEFDFKELSTIPEKQEGVPFNISVGGGTQGLCDSVWLDYNRAFEKILPIEKNFAGTFIGDIYDFRFYTCGSQRTEILNNYLFTKTQMIEKKVFI